MSTTKLYKCCCDNFGEYMVYTTTKELKVGNRFIAGVYLFGMLVIIIYVIGWTIVHKKGYQQIDYPNGYVSTKVKGFSFYPNNTNRFFDSIDVVVPAVEMDALFLTSAGVMTRQTWDVCEGESACDHDDNCTVGKHKSGVKTGNCGEGYCLEKQWCPMEKDAMAYRGPIWNLQNFTLFLKIAVKFTVFDIYLVNTEDRLGNGKPIWDYNLFRVSDIFEECGVEMQDVQMTGALVKGDITYHCDFDVNTNCRPYPKFSWAIETEEENRVSKGFNFRQAFYVMSDPLEGWSTKRVLVKYYGIRFKFNIQGHGGKWSPTQFTTTLGSGIALTAFSTMFAEILLRHCVRNKNFYRRKRLTCVSLAEEKSWIRGAKEKFMESIASFKSLSSRSNTSIVLSAPARNISDQKMCEKAETKVGRKLNFL